MDVTTIVALLGGGTIGVLVRSIVELFTSKDKNDLEEKKLYIESIRDLIETNENIVIGLREEIERQRLLVEDLRSQNEELTLRVIILEQYLMDAGLSLPN